MLMKKSQEQEEGRKEEVTEKRLALACAKREKCVAKSVAKSASKKRMLSPRSSPTQRSNTEIEERINEANNRREIFLTNRAEKACRSPKTTNSKSPKVKKALFAGLSPKQNDSSREPVSPRIKASRLEEFKVCHFISGWIVCPC